MERIELARALLIAGGSVYGALGAGHVLAAVVDVFRPTFFAPTDRAFIGSLRQAHLQLAAWFGRRADLWRAWLGFNISHGLGIAFFGLCFLLLGLYRFDTFQAHGPVRAAAVGVGAAYLLLAIRFWFFVPAVGIAAGLLCFVGSAALA